ncbi:hypothetical protein F170042I7_20900 [Blautia caecimuris]
MIMSAEKYNKEVFLIELEESLKEMKEKRKSKAKKTAQSSWRDLFTTEKK